MWNSQRQSHFYFSESSFAANFDQSIVDDGSESSPSSKRKLVAEKVDINQTPCEIFVAGLFSSSGRARVPPKIYENFPTKQTIARSLRGKFRVQLWRINIVRLSGRLYYFRGAKFSPPSPFVSWMCCARGVVGWRWLVFAVQWNSQQSLWMDFWIMQPIF